MLGILSESTAMSAKLRFRHCVSPFTEIIFCKMDSEMCSNKFFMNLQFFDNDFSAVTDIKRYSFGNQQTK